jgi:hypothetical protein
MRWLAAPEQQTCQHSGPKEVTALWREVCALTAAPNSFLVVMRVLCVFAANISRSNDITFGRDASKTYDKIRVMLMHDDSMYLIRISPIVHVQ